MPSVALALRNDQPDAPHDTMFEMKAWTSIADPRIRCGVELPRFTWDRGSLIVSGEVADLCSKRILLAELARLPGVDRIVDRLQVLPPVEMTDDQILAWTLAALAEEGSFDGCALDAADELDPSTRPSCANADHDDHIEIAIADGVVTLEGTVPTRNHARLACTIAWWVPGTRDVRDRLRPRLPEPLGVRPLVDGIRILLERDPLVDASTIMVEVIGATAILSGSVRNAIERCAVESNVWTIVEVAEVVNDLTIASGNERERDRHPTLPSESDSEVELELEVEVEVELEARGPDASVYHLRVDEIRERASAGRRGRERKHVEMSANV